MNRKTLSLAILATAIVAGPAAFATRLLGTSITGRITATSDGNQIVVDGHKYQLDSTSSASWQIRSFHMGDVVDVMLNGVPDATTTKVVEIHAHKNP